MQSFLVVFSKNKKIGVCISQKKRPRFGHSERSVSHGHLHRFAYCIVIVSYMYAWQKQEKSSKQKEHMQRIQSSYHSDQNCDVFGRYAEENIIPFRYDQYSISGGNRKQFFSKRAKYYAEAYPLPSAVWDRILVQILTFISSFVRIQKRKSTADRYAVYKWLG